MRKTLNKIGWKYTVFGITYIIIQVALELLIAGLFPVFYDKYGTYVALALVVLSVDVVGFPLLFLLTIKMPKAELGHQKFHFGNFLLCVLIMYGLVIVGAFIGMAFHLPLTLPFDNTSSDLATILMGTNTLPTVLVVGILAPIFEELIFRKLLVDRVAVHGELVAILISGLMFGLFHGNFQQCFFATFIGCFFAYIYIKTGKIIYTILLHMTLNCATSVVTLGLIKAMAKLAGEEGSDLLNGNIPTNPEEIPVAVTVIGLLMLAWVGFMFLMAFAGIILLIVFLATKKIKLERKEGDPTYGKQILAVISSPLMYLFYVLCAILFLVNYLPPILKTVIPLIKNGF